MAAAPPTQRKTRGIECPRCGHGTYVCRTENLVSWMLRVRVCSNPRCRHSFDTKEIPIDKEVQRKTLFG